MKTSALRTLFLDGNGYSRPAIEAETLFRGILRRSGEGPPPEFLSRWPKLVDRWLLLGDWYATLSYVRDWRDAVMGCAELDVTTVNINNLVELARVMLRIRSFDLIIVSHGASGDDMTILRRVERFLAMRRGRLVVFVGNEYDFLEDKIGFIRDTGADMVCSQLPSAAACYLYAGCGKTRIVELPHALNPAVYFPDPSVPRTIDVGFIGDLYLPFIGDEERTQLIRHFEAHGAARHGLTCDIRMKRIARDGWAGFLRACRAIIGAESGTYYLNERGNLLQAARTYNRKIHPEATFEEVFDRFYRGQPRISGKCISSRHFEPIGTKTCQILIEGEYNGVLKADEHYISVKRDLSNIDEAVRRFKDEGYREEMVERTHRYVLAEHTYAHRVRAMLRHLETL